MINAAVIGLGRIGSANDAAPNAVPLSHVGAVLATAGVRLAAMVDVDSAARTRAKSQWSDRTDAPVVASIAELDVAAVDVIAVCSPTASRKEDVAAAIALDPRVVLVEKPLAEDLVTAENIIHHAARAGVTLRVNFNRRFDPASRAFRERFPGPPKKVVLRYGKGLHNYASHMVDLLLDWCGPVTAVQAFDEDTGNGNPSFRCIMEASFDAVFVGMSGLSYDQFEIDFFFEDLRLEYASGGAERRAWRPVADRLYRGYTQLAHDDSVAEQSIVGGFRETYAAIRDHLRDGAPLGGCGAADAVAGLAVLDAVPRSARARGRLVCPNNPLGGRVDKAAR